MFPATTTTTIAYDEQGVFDHELTEDQIEAWDEQNDAGDGTFIREVIQRLKKIISEFNLGARYQANASKAAKELLKLLTPEVQEEPQTQRKANSNATFYSKTTSPRIRVVEILSALREILGLDRALDTDTISVDELHNRLHDYFMVTTDSDNIVPRYLMLPSSDLARMWNLDDVQSSILALYMREAYVAITEYTSSQSQKKEKVLTDRLNKMLFSRQTIRKYIGFYVTSDKTFSVNIAPILNREYQNNKLGIHELLQDLLREKVVVQNETGTFSVLHTKDKFPTWFLRLNPKAADKPLDKASARNALISAFGVPKTYCLLVPVRLYLGFEIPLLPVTDEKYLNSDGSCEFGLATSENLSRYIRTVIKDRATIVVSSGKANKKELDTAYIRKAFECDKLGYNIHDFETESLIATVILACLNDFESYKLANGIELSSDSYGGIIEQPYLSVEPATTSA